MIQTDLLHEHLENAISKLHLLITFTQEDIEDIKQAKHDSIFSRNNDKVCIIKEFEIAKNMIDKEMLTLTQNNPHLSLTDILDEKSNLLLSNMRKTLENLKKINSFIVFFYLFQTEIFLKWLLTLLTFLRYKKFALYMCKTTQMPLHIKKQQKLE